jgi:hypothetical protein
LHLPEIAEVGQQEHWAPSKLLIGIRIRFRIENCPLKPKVEKTSVLCRAVVALYLIPHLILFYVFRAKNSKSELSHG